MGKETAISWTHHTFCPWWGCEKVSPACTHCYAQTFADRFPASRGLWGKGSARRFQSDKYWSQPLNWNRNAAAAGERRRVFCASMADVFEDREDLIPHRARLFDLIRRTPNLDWLLLTKRPENFGRLITSAKHHNEVTTETVDLIAWLGSWLDENPPANIWLGTTVENQEMADKRIPALLSIPAKVRFLSCEPLLGPVDLKLLWHNDTARWDALGNPVALRKIDWVICGGESGPHARPMHPDWARSLRDQCAAASVPFHFKQWGKWHPITRSDGIQELPFGAYLPHSTPPFGFLSGTDHGRLLDGQLHDAFPQP